MIKKIIYAINKFNKSVISRMTLPKTKLFTKKKVIIVQVIINSVVLIDTFFDKLTIFLSKAVNKFDNLILMRDFNVNKTKDNSSGLDKLEELRLISPGVLNKKEMQLSLYDIFSVFIFNELYLFA